MFSRVNEDAQVILNLAEVSAQRGKFKFRGLQIKLLVTLSSADPARDSCLVALIKAFAKVLDHESEQLPLILRVRRVLYLSLTKPREQLTFEKVFYSFDQVRILSHLVDHHELRYLADKGLVSDKCLKKRLDRLDVNHARQDCGSTLHPEV